MKKVWMVEYRFQTILKNEKNIMYQKFIKHNSVVNHSLLYKKWTFDDGLSDSGA